VLSLLEAFAREQRGGAMAMEAAAGGQAHRARGGCARWSGARRSAAGGVLSAQPRLRFYFARGLAWRARRCRSARCRWVPRHGLVHALGGALAASTGTPCPCSGSSAAAPARDGNHCTGWHGLGWSCRHLGPQRLDLAGGRSARAAARRSLLGLVGAAGRASSGGAVAAVPSSASGGKRIVSFIHFHSCTR